jgi:hypothetical protein
MAMGAVAWKIMGTGGAILAGVVATKVIDAIWARAVAYAMITGLAVGAAKTLATRRAAKFYEKSAGHLPGEIADEPV